MNGLREVRELTQARIDALLAEGMEHLQAHDMHAPLNGPDPECPACDDLYGQANLLREWMRTTEGNQSLVVGSPIVSVTDSAGNTWVLQTTNDAPRTDAPCTCVCHSYPEHGKLQDALDALKWHQDKLNKLTAGEQS